MKPCYSYIMTVVSYNYVKMDVGVCRFPITVLCVV